MKQKHIFLGLIWLFIVGCYDEKDIVVNDEDEYTYSLATGHDYDEILHKWHEKYGFYPLYIFEDKDLYWNNTMWDNHEWDVNKGFCAGSPGNPDYVGKQIELIEKVFMDLHPDDLLKYFPLKMLLCSDLYQTKRSTKFDPTVGGFVHFVDSTAVWAYRGYDFIAINGGSEGVKEITTDEKCDLQLMLNAIYLEYLAIKGILTGPDEFFEVSDYKYVDLFIDDLIAKGFLARGVLVDGNINLSKKNDFILYLKLAAFDMSTLKSDPGWEYDGVGALNPERDVNGLCEKKYKIVIRYLKSLGIATDKLQYPAFD